MQILKYTSRGVNILKLSCFLQDETSFYSSLFAIMRILDIYIFTTVPKPKFFQLRFPEGYKKGENLFRPEKGTENSGSPIPHSRNTSPQGLRDPFYIPERK